MRTRRIGVLAALALAGFGTGSALAAGIEGVWRTASGEQARIARCGAAMCITLLTSPAKGTVLSSDLREDGRSRWSGTLYNPEDGKTYSGSAALDGGGALTLRGCALKIFCKSQTWTRLP